MFSVAGRCLETPGINRYDKMSLLVNRWLTQIHLVAPGGLSTVAKARRGRPISIWWGRGAPWGALGRIRVDPPTLSGGSTWYWSVLSSILWQTRSTTSKKHRYSPRFLFLAPYDVPGHLGALLNRFRRRKHRKPHFRNKNHSA